LPVQTAHAPIGDALHKIVEDSLSHEPEAYRNCTEWNMPEFERRQCRETGYLTRAETSDIMK
jgi:hypothetical protein